MPSGPVIIYLAHRYRHPPLSIELGKRSCPSLSSVEIACSPRDRTTPVVSSTKTAVAASFLRLYRLRCHTSHTVMSTDSKASALVFPHPSLSPITGQPTSTSLKLLHKEVFTNARAIPSTRGGGAHGHLGLVMPAANYLALTGHAFMLPLHPGAAPVHAVGATAAQITETNRVFTATLAELTTANQFRQEIKKLILAAVNSIYLASLEDDTFGYADVSPNAMLVHLKSSYGTISRAELEANRNKLNTSWNVDEPIEDLWPRLREIKRISSEADEEIADTTIMDLTALMFEATGVFSTACDNWRIKPEADKTFPNFVIHFNTENKERLRKLTLAQAGFHGANKATTSPSIPHQPTPTAVSPSPATTLRTPRVTPNDCDVKMYYCWTHGLGTNASHTSATCERKAEGHKDNATVINMQGGNNTIMTGRPRRRSLQE